MSMLNALKVKSKRDSGMNVDCQGIYFRKSLPVLPGIAHSTTKNVALE